VTREQRAAVNEMLARPQRIGQPSVDELRAGFAQMMAQMRIADGIRTTATRLADRPALLVEAEGGARPGTILYFHGGSNVVGSPQTALSLTAALVVRTGIRSISLDYRLAPEHPFPAGHDDALAAYRALLKDGIDPLSIVFVGDSAGGGLAVGTCLTARNAGLPRPAAVVAFSAGLDATRTGRSVDTREGIDPFFTRVSLTRTSAMWLAGADPRSKSCSPRRRART
jgi:epsilon-lactone hydrolase